MAEKIDKLTPEQEVALEAHFQEHLQVIYNLKLVNKEAAAEIIQGIYASMKLAAPEVVFCGSTGACKEEINKRLGSTPSSYPAVYGQGEIYWLSRFDFAKKHLGVDFGNDAPLRQLWMRQCSELYVWYAYDTHAFVSERPLQMLIDEESELHSAIGPALAFADGYKEYFWHGVKVPAEWIENKESVDPSLALTWENMEQRHALAQILGWEYVLSKLEQKVIDVDPDPEIGTLFDVTLPDGERERFLRVKCGTGRNFVLCVGDEYDTALEANASTYPSLTADELRNKVFRT